MKRTAQLKSKRPMKRGTKGLRRFAWLTRAELARGIRPVRVRLKTARQIRNERTAYAVVRARSGGQCEVELRDHRCWRRQDHTHHVVKRSQGGKYRGPNMLVAICAPHHDLADNASVDQVTTLSDGQVLAGRLIVTARGNGRFAFTMRASAAAQRREREMGVTS